MERMTPAERRAVWEQRLERYSVSEQTVADFCKVEGISPASLYRWKSRLGSRGSIGKTPARNPPGESSQRRPVVSAATSNRRAAAATSFTELVVTGQPNAEHPNAEHPNANQSNGSQQIAEQSDVARAQLPNGISISLGRDTTLAAAIVDRLIRYEPPGEATEYNSMHQHEPNPSHPHHKSNSTLHRETNSTRQPESNSTRHHQTRSSRRRS